MTEASNRSAGHSLVRRAANNIETALQMLARSPRERVFELSPFTWEQLGIAAAAALAIFLFGMIFVDAALTRSAGHLPRSITWFFEQITDFGLGAWFLWPLGLLFIVIAALPMTLPRIPQLVLAALAVRVGFLFVAIGLPGLFASIIKRMIGRARPLVTGVIDPHLFSPFIWRADYASLPSGHATTAFAVLVAFGTLWPRARTALWIYAVLIAISRVVVTAHFMTDVLAGAVVGAVGALMVRRWFALRHLGFSVRPDGTVRQWPGPSLRRIKAVARGLLS